MAHWDVVVIGGGAAGLCAAAEAAAAGLTCLLLDRMGGGGELMNLGALQDVEAAMAGPDLAADLLNAAIAAGVELGIAEVTGLAIENTGWRVATDDESHHARAVIVAPGLAPGTLGLDNEADFEGQGLSHCAACDGPLYRDQPVVVAGADRWAIAEACELVGVASSVTLVTQRDHPSADLWWSHITAMEKVLPLPLWEGAGGRGVPARILRETPPPSPLPQGEGEDFLRPSSGSKMCDNHSSAGEGFAVLHARITGLEGASGLEAVLVQPADGGPPQRIPARAVFVQTGRRAAFGFLPDGPTRDEAGCLIVDDALQCSLPGLFAAGEARSGFPRTLAAAMADGRRSAVSARTLLNGR